MNRVIQISATTLLVFLSACQNESTIASTDPINAPPTVSSPPPLEPTLSCSAPDFPATSTVDALPGGIWLGSLLDCANGVQHDYISAIISEDGQFRILDDDEHLLAGYIQTSGDTLAGTGVDFAATNIEYLSGSTTGLWIDGRVAERKTLEGRWGTEWGFYGYFTFGYVQETYERPTSFADLAGVWKSYVRHLGNPVEGIWTIEPNGRFNGQDDLGCLQSGQFSLIDNQYDVIAIHLAVTECDLTGSYTGLAALEELVDFWEKGVKISVDDGARALRMILTIERP